MLPWRPLAHRVSSRPACAQRGRPESVVVVPFNCACEAVAGVAAALPAEAHLLGLTGVLEGNLPGTAHPRRDCAAGQQHQRSRLELPPQAPLPGLQGLRNVARKHKYQRSCKKHSLESLVLTAWGDSPVSDCFAQLLPLQVSCTNVLNVGKPSMPCCVPHGGQGCKCRSLGTHARLQTDASTEKCQQWCVGRTMQGAKGRLVRVCQTPRSSAEEQQLQQNSN